MATFVELQKLPTSYEKGSIVIVPYFEESLKKKDPYHWKHLLDTLHLEKGEAKKGTQTKITHDGILFIFVHLGQEKKCTLQHIQEDVAQALRDQRNAGRTIAIDTSALLSALSIDVLLYELTFCTHLACFEYTKFKSNSKEVKKRKIVIYMKSPSKNDAQIMYDAERMAEGIIYTREIVNEPPNIATPEYMVNLIKNDAKALKWKVAVFDAKKMRKMGMNLINAVGQGSDEPPYFVHVSYKGNPKSKEVTALVGKGVCFDTGGVQTKDGFSMNNMKHDKGGAVTVMGILRTLSKMKAKINLEVYIPFVKNAVDGGAYQPDDIFVAYNKKTVEIRHTDAEGRLILADALAYACERKPSHILDFATLTGAATIALGPEYVSMMGTDQEIMSALVPLGEKINDKVWQLPLNEKYAEYLKSGVADLANVPFAGRQPGTITAGMFLKNFVLDSIPWIHFDIAATIEKDKASGIYSTYATGTMVRLISQYLLSKSA